MPEPATWLMLTLGGLGAGSVRLAAAKSGSTSSNGAHSRRSKTDSTEILTTPVERPGLLLQYLLPPH